MHCVSWVCCSFNSWGRDSYKDWIERNNSRARIHQDQKKERTNEIWKKIRSCNRKEFDNFIPYWLKNHSQGDVCCVKALAVSCFLWNLPEVNDENGKDQRKCSNLETFEGLTWPAHQALLQRDQQFSFGSCFRQMI